MNKYALSGLVAGILLLLTGCQTFNTGSGSLLPASMHRMTDNEISLSVQSALVNSNQFVGIPITIQTVQGNVSLSGYVKTIRQSDVAADLASKVEGVKFVENNLIVRK